MKLEDQTLEKILKVMTPFVLSELEEVVSFEGKSDQQRDDIMKASIKSLEVTTILFSKFLNEDSIDGGQLEKVFQMVAEDKLNEAAELINKF